MAYIFIQTKQARPLLYVYLRKKNKITLVIYPNNLKLLIIQYK